MTQVIQWIQNPRQSSEIKNFDPWKEKCAVDPSSPPACWVPNSCKLTSKEVPGETLNLQTCMRCPNNFPWVQDPEVRWFIMICCVLEDDLWMFTFLFTGQWILPLRSLFLSFWKISHDYSLLLSLFPSLFSFSCLFTFHSYTQTKMLSTKKLQKILNFFHLNYLPQRFLSFLNGSSFIFLFFSMSLFTYLYTFSNNSFSFFQLIILIKLLQQQSTCKSTEISLINFVLFLLLTL